MERQRSGLTLAEVLVVILIIALLLSMLVPALFYVRSLSLQTSSKTKVSALFFAAAQHADLNGGKLPPCVYDTADPNSMSTVQYFLLWYMDGGKAYQEEWGDSKKFPFSYSFPALISPADYTIHSIQYSSEPRGMLCSYSVNAQVFGRRANLPKTFSDGTSHTILFSEHLANCNAVAFQYSTNMIFGTPGDFVPPRRPTFADGGLPDHRTWGDVYPITSSSPPGSKASIPGKTFQVRPSLLDCDPTIPQTPHSSLICGFADGSVRSIHANVSEPSFWGLVTMNGGEPVSD